MDALEQARWNAEKAAGDSDSSRAQDGILYALIAQAEAQQQANAIAERQAAAMERIADALHMDHNDLTVIDGLYALVEAIINHP